MSQFIGELIIEAGANAHGIGAGDAAQFNEFGIGQQQSPRLRAQQPFAVSDSSIRPTRLVGDAAQGLAILFIGYEESLAGQQGQDGIDGREARRPRGRIVVQTTSCTPR